MANTQFGTISYTWQRVTQNSTHWPSVYMKRAKPERLKTSPMAIVELVCLLRGTDSFTTLLLNHVGFVSRLEMSCVRCMATVASGTQLG